jgi:hypothetical protein
MGSAAFEQAWAQGRSLAGSRAVEYALEEPQPDPTQPEGPPAAGGIGAVS